MEFPSTWLSEMEMEHTTFIHQSNELNSLDYSFDGLNFMSGTTTPMENPHMGIEIPAIELKSNTTTWNSCTTTTNHLSAKASASSSSHLILNSPPVASHEQDYGLRASVIMKPRFEEGSNIGNMTFPPPMISQDSYDYKAQNILSPKYGQGAMRIRHAQDHIIAERNRRKKLNQLFITLSAIVPGLKKMDKATALGGAIEYVKHLQQRLKTLEEQATKSTVVESVVLVKRFWVSSIGDISSSNENVDSCSDDQPLPEVEARTLDKDVLIRIRCKKHQGCLVKILSEVEKLPLMIVNSRVLQFGNSFDITIVAQMEVEFGMETKKLVTNLMHPFLKFT